MIETAENLARDYGITREAGRRLRRCAATSAPRRPGQPASSPTKLVPVAVPQKKGEPSSSTRDEGIRADATARDASAKLQAAR